MIATRRGFLAGVGALLAAPLVARADNLMKIRGQRVPLDMEVPAWCPDGWAPCNGALVHRSQFPELFRSVRGYLFDKGDGMFHLPHGSVFYNPFGENATVSLVAVKPQRGANGRVSQPGFLATAQVPAVKIFNEPQQKALEGHFHKWVADRSVLRSRLEEPVVQTAMFPMCWVAAHEGMDPIAYEPFRREAA